MFEYRDSAIHDVLTGLYARKYLDEVGPRLLNRATQTDEDSLAVIFFDIDHFKKVNDLYGHKAGDSVLRVVGSTLVSSLRPNELAFRYGGEELVVLLYASEKDCFIIAERIRASVADYDFHAGKKSFKVTLSAGIAVARRKDSLNDLLHRADVCLYTAKELGRDRTIVESESPNIISAHG